MNQLTLLLPEIFLSVLSLVILLGESFSKPGRRIWSHIGLVGLGATLIHQILFFVNKSFPLAGAIQPANVAQAWIQYPPVFGMLSIDSLAVFFKIAILSSVILVLWLSLDYREFADKPMGTYAALILLATVGMMLLVSSIDLLMAVLALELLSITSFIITGFIVNRRSSAEAALKFFLVGTLSTGIFLFGISYYYGYFGTTSLDPLLQVAASGGSSLALSLILVLFIAGIGFKLAMVPFHMWAPDAYEGAPTPVTAFLSVAPKAAAVGFLVRLLTNHEGLELTPLLAGLAAITMTVGNIGALQQTNVKRLLAYSSIAQIGYILVALVAGGALGSQAAMVYTFVYLFMNLGLFAGLLIVSNQSGVEDISAFDGLYSKSMGLSLAIVVFMLSLTGIPPMAGFIGKFTIFAAAIVHPDLLWLSIVAVLNSVISLYYYFRIVHAMFFKPATGTTRLQYSPALVSCLIITLGITLIAGLLPNHILSWVRNVVGS